MGKNRVTSFKLPHLLFLMLGLILFMSLMTYVVPAGNYAVNPDGTLNGNDFQLLGAQTPVSPWQAMMYILSGLENSAYVIAVLLINGGAIGVILGTKAIDKIIDYALYKLKDRGIIIVVPTIVAMMGLLGAFGGGDHLVALIPVGIMIARKLRVDPIMAIAMTTFAIFMGSSWSPTALIVHWTMMDVPFYSGFAVRFTMMCLMIALNCIMVTRYALKVSKDPTKSAMGNTDWTKEFENIDESTLKEVTLSPRDLMIVFLFFFQYIVIVLAMSVFGMDRAVQPAVMILVSILCGLLAKWKIDDIGNAFSKGCGGMAFVCVVIGLANTMSIIMTEGNILHTIVYYACLPLRNLSAGFAAVGICIVITAINFFIPSMSAKAAILFPIVRPMCQALGLTAQVGIQAFQIGDQFMNALTPCLGMTVASCSAAGVPFDRYVRFAIRIVAPLWLISIVVLYVLSTIGWMG